MIPPVIDVDAILAPIPGDSPGGADPRENASGNAPYYRVKDARNTARAEERAAVDADAPTPEAWGTVIDAGVELLATQAKDLEVAAWLTEALVRTDGFVGLRDGLTVIARLVEEHWDHLYPEPDEDGLETKVSPVAGLSGSGATGTLDRPIRNTPLTEGASGAYSFWDYEQAVELEKITDPSRRAARTEAGTITLEAFRKSVSETRPESLRDTLAAVMECEAALARMTGAFDLAAGLDSPSVSALQELLGAVGGCLRHVASDRLASLAAAGGGDEAGEAAAGVPGAPGEGAPAGAGPARRPGEFANRDEALAQLTLIAAHFRRTEPHSPIAYTLEDAVRRARMTLPELLMELAPEREHVQHILLAAGIRFQEQQEE